MTEQILKIINKLYHIDATKIHEKVKGGYLTDNFSIGNDSQKYFLKKYRDSAADYINQIHQAKFFFAKNSIPVILPLKNKNNKTYFIFENEYYAIFPFVNGKIIGRSDLTKKSMTSLGQLLAKMHLRSRDNCPKFIEKTTKGWEKENLVNEASQYLEIINKKKKLDEFDIAAKKHIDIKLELSNRVNQSYQDLNLPDNHLLHGDFHEHNVFFNDKEEIAHIYDFEKTRIGPRVLELIRLIDLATINYEFEDVNYKNAKIIFDAYSNIYPISSQEFEKGLLAYYYSFFCTLWIPKAHYIDNNHRPDIFLIRGLPGLEYLRHNFDKHFSRFLSLAD